MLVRIIILVLFAALAARGVFLLAHKGPRKSKRNRKAAGITVICFAFASLVVVCALCRHSVFAVSVPRGDLHWSDVRPEGAELCVPAAYSDENGRILGQYVKDGKKFNALRPHSARVSFIGDKFYVAYDWVSGEGFQQHTLVMDSHPKSFTDRRYKVRRALCKNARGTYIVQSNLPMTLTAFAAKLAATYTDAVNLDMGHCGYGYFRWHGLYVPLSLWTVFNRDEQTNWVYVR